MKNLRLYTLFLGLLALSSLAANAAQLASAKVLRVKGSISYASEGGAPSPLTAGTILTQGDSITTSAASSADLVFSNGSELTIKESTNITLAELSQETFAGNKSYEQLKADPSKSQALLELNYGKVFGHVKKLRKGSKFHIETPLGTAAIRGTKFEISFSFDANKGAFTLGVLNLDGLVDLSSKYSGKVTYGQGSTGAMKYDAEATDVTTTPVPPRHTVVIGISEEDPAYNAIIDAVKNFPPVNGLEIIVKEEEDEGEGEGEGDQDQGDQDQGDQDQGDQDQGDQDQGDQDQGNTGDTGGFNTPDPVNTPDIDEAITVTSPNGPAT